MYVGNDVVDLEEPDNARAVRRDRFRDRICAPSERDALAGAGDPAVRLWCLFAAKEAAYKVLVKLGRDPGFAHRRLVVSDAMDEVRFEDVVLHLHVDVDHARGLVHAVASTHPERPECAVRSVDAGADESRECRRLLSETFAPLLGCAASDLRIERAQRPGTWDGYGPPVLLRAGCAVPDLDVSLSHDGRFVAAVGTCGPSGRAGRAPQALGESAQAVGVLDAAPPWLGDRCGAESRAGDAARDAGDRVGVAVRVRRG